MASQKRVARDTRLAPAVIALALGALMAAQAAVSLHLQRASDLPPPGTSQGAAIQWTPEVFRWVTLGQVQAAVDLLMIRALLDDPRAPRAADGHAASFPLLDLASRLDPSYFDLHQNGSVYLGIAQHDSEGALELAQRANEWMKHDLPAMPSEFRERYWKGGWSIPLIIAYLKLFEFQDLPGAGQAFRESAALPGAPAYLHSIAARFEKPGGIFEVGARILGFMIPATPEGRARSELIRKRNLMVVHHEVWRANFEFDRFLTQGRHSRSEQGLSKAWELFRVQGIVPATDSQGGRLGLDPKSGRIRTTTPLEKVFGVG